MKKGKPSRSRKRQRWTIGSILVGIAVLVLLLLGYRLNWTWTGFLNKTLWDWMQLFLIPVVLALVALLFNASSRHEQEMAERRYQSDQRLASDKQRENRRLAVNKQGADLLQSYFDRMSELLLTNHLRTSASNDEVRIIARARTLSVLDSLDVDSSKENVLWFLYESDLINVKDTIIRLDKADLSGVSISNVKLSNANLRGVNLYNARLWRVNLKGSDLRDADLWRVYLSDADLRGAHIYLSYYHFEKEMNERGINRDNEQKDEPNQNILWEIYNTAGYMRGATITKEQMSAIKLKVSYPVKK